MSLMMKIINNRLNNPDRYSERGMTYTKNGALTRLLRYGRRNTDDFGLIDSLVMTLDGNRVLSVEDGAGSLVYENSFDFKSNGGSGVYEYDGNGSLSVDPYKGFAFEYDLLGNLKRTESEYTTSYVYSSTGERLSVESKFNGCIAKPHKFFFSDWEEDGVVFNSTSDDSGDSDIMDRWSKMMYPRDTEFCGPFIFEYSVLDKFLFDGGYCTFKDGQTSFHYYLQDHLGNNRAVVAEDGTMEQITEYYPFGGIYGDVSTNPGLQLYKYNGKEFDHSLSLDLYDYGARLYDPALVVWTGVDPLAEKYGDVSPYVYCGDNPISYVDNNGMEYMEYDQNNKKISNLGGNEFDFYHLENHNTKVVNRKSGMVNIIKGGERLIRNYTHRTNDTTISQLTSEFLNETGPEKSMFTDFNNSNKGPFESLRSFKSVYTSEARHLSLINKYEKKGYKSINTFLANPMTAGMDMWEQFIGEAGISWYDMGDSMLYILTDAKSNSSLLYHTHFFPNRTRNKSGRGWGNTYQTYIWTESKSVRNQKNEKMWDYIHKKNCLNTPY